LTHYCVSRVLELLYSYLGALGYYHDVQNYKHLFPLSFLREVYNSNVEYQALFVPFGLLSCIFNMLCATDKTNPTQ